MEDEDKKSAKTELIVEILDQNDAAPKFSHPIDEIEIGELTEINSFIYQTHAEDQDSGKNGEVRRRYFCYIICILYTRCVFLCFFYAVPFLTVFSPCFCAFSDKNFPGIRELIRPPLHPGHLRMAGIEGKVLKMNH